MKEDVKIMSEAVKVPHSDTMRAAIESDRVRFLYDGLPLAIISNVLIAAALAPLLWGSAGSAAVSFWLALLGSVQVLRAVSWATHRRSPATPLDSKPWLSRFRVGTLATGLSWGLVSILIFPMHDIQSQFFLAFALTGLMAGAMSSLSMDRTALLAFTVPMLAPLFARLFTTNDGISMATGVVMIVFAIFMSVSARRFSAAEQSNLRLRHEMLWRESMLRRYEFIVNTVNDMMSVVSRERRYEAVNDRWCMLLEKSRESVIGRTLDEIQEASTSAQYRTAELERCFSERMPVSFQTVVDIPKIGARECAITYYPYEQTQGEVNHVVVVTRDVTELAQSERELIKARDAAEFASRAKSEFLASMSHELRTPLNAILGFSQLLGMDAKLSLETQEQLGEIERAGQHLLSLINDLIDLARIESGKLDLSLEPVLVQSVIKDSLALVAPIARKHGIALENIGDECQTEAIFVDYVRLRQVLINLFSNAIKYNRSQGKVRLSCGIRDGRLRISVIDNGPGIPADKQSRIFNAFDRLGAESGSIEGTGIGLVITQRIVEAMGGNIGFESVEGEGATFWVEFPFVHSADFSVAEEPTQVVAAEESSMQSARQVVLYIEDNPMNLGLMRHIFALRKEFELRDAHTAELGVELARAEAPAMILMDINLPGMDGFAALKVLKADPKTAHIPVIAISANAMKGDEARGLEAGFEVYLTKPINVPALFSVLDKMRE